MRTRSYLALARSASVIACAGAYGQCDAQWFTNVGKPGLDGPVWGSTVWDDGGGSSLFACGEFINAGGLQSPGVAKWDGGSWVAVPNAPCCAVYAMTEFDQWEAGPSYIELYVGGDIGVAGQELGFLKYGDSTWRGAGAPGQAYHTVYSFARIKSGAWNEPAALIVGGEFGIYHAVGGAGPDLYDFGPPDSVYAMTTDQRGVLPVLYVGGAGGPFGNIAQWDRLNQFRPLATGTSGQVLALTIFDDGSGPALFAGGDFTDAGGVAVHSIAKWDGESWSDVGGGVTGGLLAGVYSLAVFDDGSGEALFVGGNFDSAGGQTAASVARWDGVNWSALGEGVTGDGATVLTMTPFKQGNKEFLYIAGWFDHAGGLPANNIARWGCPQDKPCYADCDASGGLDLFDFLCFTNAFNAGDVYADCTADGPLDLFDFLCFVNAFNDGCP